MEGGGGHSVVHDATLRNSAFHPPCSLIWVFGVLIIVRCLEEEKKVSIDCVLCLLVCLQLVMANFETNMSWAKIEVLGVEKGNGTTLTRIHNTSDIETDPVSNALNPSPLPLCCVH